MCVTPCLIVFICLEGIVFVVKEGEVSKTSLVICKDNVIMISFPCSNWGWPPQIIMDLTSKFSGLLAFSDLCNRLLCCLHINIRFTKGRFSRCCLQLYSSHEVLVNKLLCDFEGNMTICQWNWSKMSTSCAMFPSSSSCVTL